MRWTTRHYKSWLCLTILLLANLITSAPATETRGVHRTALTANKQDGKELSLYKGSFALLVGVSQ